MESGFDWSLVEDASPENRELGSIARQLGKLHENPSTFDWAKSRQWCCDLLVAIRETCGKSRDLEERLEGRKFEVGGSEHSLVELPEFEGRIFKITGDNSFGTSWDLFPSDPELTGKHFHATVCEDPIYYLRRMMLVNMFTAEEYQTRYEGILPPGPHLKVPRLCISQGYVDSPNASRHIIESGMRALEFEKISEDTFLNIGIGVLIGDAAPRNVKEIEGVLVPFDAIAEVASPRVIEWALEQGFSHSEWI